MMFSSISYLITVYFLHYDEELNQVSKEVYTHPIGELWNLSVFPADRRIIATCYDAGFKYYKFVSFICIYWQIVSDKVLSAAASYKVICGKWNPHHNCNSFVTVIGGTVSGTDIRSNKLEILKLFSFLSRTTFSIQAHPNYVRDIDLNPNRNYYLATAGDDCRILFWDTRVVKQPMKSVLSHSHWVWSIRYNPIHDQLFISSGSDARVVLHCIVSISSEALEMADASEEPDCPSNQFSLYDLINLSPNRSNRDIFRLTDGVIRRYEDHEESVYCCEWSSVDPWVFASLSYDGRVIINTVPRKIKYSILNL
ncbi:unnamed protein product [Soboliphyme baturini]|uniref:WD_REPEATS_REGION domain-containing protein n=1 Tax=Soboliphyme baturini TaxID=241478 RepID=A0A183IM30_9BILA|nr:unnamed protein product [Soboliphyme baturini]